VALRSDFAAGTDQRGMDVFLSPEGDCNGLYVSRVSGGAFGVRERARSTSNVPRTPPALAPEPAGVTIKPRQPRTPSFSRGRQG
jgi:hypothetical protein